MEGKRENSFSKLEWMINALLVLRHYCRSLMSSGDSTLKTPLSSGRTPARDLPQSRAARWKVKDEMVLAPAVDFLMGSDLKFVLATNRLPQLDWRYNGGNFQN